MNILGTHPPFLHWLPDECFFSICSRQHFFWCNHSPDVTLNYLFGNSANKLAHDLPKNLNLLSEDAKPAWGTTDTIIIDHTIAPIFFPFQSSEHVADLKHALSGPHPGSIKYRLGLLTGRFGAAHPLKACIECMADDKLIHGVAYWHLSHQLPGVTVCPAHACLLLESRDNRQWSRKGQWVLPDESNLLKASQVPLSLSALTALKTMSVATVALFEVGKTTQFEPSSVAQVYREAMRNFWALQGGDTAADSFANHCKTIQPFPPFSSLPCSRQCATGFISQMTRKPRGYCHPLKHLALITWLFGSTELFLDTYQCLTDKRQNSRGADFLSSVVVPNIYEQRPKRGQVTGAPRPKKVFDHIKEEILKTLLSGTSKKEVSSRFKISISTVNRLLRLNPTVEQQIANKNKSVRLEEQRKAWRSIVEQAPSSSAKEIRGLIPSTYAWLYRNDRNWLVSQTRSLPSGRHGNHAAVDWNDRDIKLCILIMKTVLTHPTGTKKILKRDLYQLIPNLYSSLEKRLHYTKSRTLISELTR